MIKQSKGTKSTTTKKVYVAKYHTIQNGAQERLLGAFSHLDVDHFITGLNKVFKLAVIGDRRDDIDEKDKEHLETLSIVISLLEDIKEAYVKEADDNRILETELQIKKLKPFIRAFKTGNNT